MSGTFQYGYGNPDSYSDWAKYAGLDRKTGGFSTDSSFSKGLALEQADAEAKDKKAVAAAVPVSDAGSAVMPNSSFGIQPDTSFGSASQPSFGAPQPQNPYAITPQASSVGVSPSLGNSNFSWRDRLKNAIKTNIGD